MIGLLSLASLKRAMWARVARRLRLRALAIAETRERMGWSDNKPVRAEVEGKVGATGDGLHIRLRALEH
ncbi:MAG: hypothetical protein AAFO73_04365 [Pseudomonadota bacterium]